MEKSFERHKKPRVFVGSLVHLLTASTAILALYTLYAIMHHHYILAFWLMGGAIFVDAIDGTLARATHVKTLLPKIDGTLLDNIMDYMNYVLTPCFFLLIHPTLLPAQGRAIILSIVLLASAYQFTQADAKTEDNFFRGFPCYWNFTVFYMFLLAANPWFNFAALFILSVLVFVPIKYVYPSRMDYLSHHRSVKLAMLFASIIYGMACLGILITYPVHHPSLVIVSVIFLIFYFAASIYRTIFPLQ